MTDPDNKDPKNQDETLEQPTAAAEESGDTELADEELGDAAGGFPESAEYLESVKPDPMIPPPDGGFGGGIQL